jgi:hypothetical protein
MYHKTKLPETTPRKEERERERERERAHPLSKFAIDFQKHEKEPTCQRLINATKVL